MRKYIPHILIISFIFLLVPTAHVATYAGEIEDAREEVRRNPDDASAHNNLGIAYYYTGKYQEAIKSYKQALRIDPDDAGVHAILGLAYCDSGKYEEAIESYKQAIRINPDGGFGPGLTHIC